ncbi:MAG: type II toxin-antitoxin system VapC family toxin [Actinomycetota bacterium]|nr:type II toxin-antitoxin system VapC family toxin [Actinomycetota bacterium]
MSTFADSTALVKLYADESGFEEMRALNALAVAQIVRVQVPAALWRKHRIGELSADDAQVLTAAFEADYFGAAGDDPRFAVVRLGAEVMNEAARLCARYGLRAQEGIELASAMATRRADPSCTMLAAFHGPLRASAAAEGFALLPA